MAGITERLDAMEAEIRNIRIKDLTHTASWRVETPEDVDQYLEDLKKNLLAELGTTDILNVEF